MGTGRHLCGDCGDHGLAERGENAARPGWGWRSMGIPWGFLGLWDWKSLMIIINCHYYHYCYLDDLDDLDAEANLSVCLAKQQLPVLIH